MYLKRWGSGRRVFVGLHGWTGGFWTFEPLIPFMPSDCTFYGVDLPGYGTSPRPDPFELKTVIDELIHTFRAVEASRFTIVGNCSGGVLALEAVHRWHARGEAGGRLERLVLLDLFAYTPWYFGLLLSRPFGPWLYRALFDSAPGRRLINRSVRRHDDSEMDFEEQFSRVDHEVTYRYMEILSREVRELPPLDLDVPMNFVHGEKTFRAVRNSLDLIRGLYPGAGVTSLTGAGHLPIREATERLAGLIFGVRES